MVQVRKKFDARRFLQEGGTQREVRFGNVILTPRQGFSIAPGREGPATGFSRSFGGPSPESQPTISKAPEPTPAQETAAKAIEIKEITEGAKTPAQAYGKFREFIGIGGLTEAQAVGVSAERTKKLRLAGGTFGEGLTPAKEVGVLTAFFGRLEGGKATETDISRLKEAGFIVPVTSPPIESQAITPPTRTTLPKAPKDFKLSDVSFKESFFPTQRKTREERGLVVFEEGVPVSGGKILFQEFVDIKLRSGLETGTQAVRGGLIKTLGPEDIPKFIRARKILFDPKQKIPLGPVEIEPSFSPTTLAKFGVFAPTFATTSEFAGSLTRQAQALEPPITKVDALVFPTSKEGVSKVRVLTETKRGDFTISGASQQLVRDVPRKKGDIFLGAGKGAFETPARGKIPAQRTEFNIVGRGDVLGDARQLVRIEGPSGEVVILSKALGGPKVESKVLVQETSKTIFKPRVEGRDIVFPTTRRLGKIQEQEIVSFFSPKVGDFRTFVGATKPSGKAVPFEDISIFGKVVKIKPPTGTSVSGGGGVQGLKFSQRGIQKAITQQTGGILKATQPVIQKQVSQDIAKAVSPKGFKVSPPKAELGLRTRQQDFVRSQIQLPRGGQEVIQLPKQAEVQRQFVGLSLVQPQMDLVGQKPVTGLKTFQFETAIPREEFRFRQAQQFKLAPTQRTEQTFVTQPRFGFSFGFGFGRGKPFIPAFPIFPPMGIPTFAREKVGTKRKFRRTPSLGPILLEEFGIETPRFGKELEETGLFPRVFKRSQELPQLGPIPVKRRKK